MKKIGFLSFGHYGDYPGSRTRTGADMLHQAMDLAVGAEEIGLDGAFYRVHHFAQQQMSPFPLLAAAGVRTSNWTWAAEDVNGAALAKVGDQGSRGQARGARAAALASRQ